MTPNSYSPERRTALVLSGVGTAGAYHAGVLRALHEAGVKIDIVGGLGIGAVGALFTAVDGAQRLWDEKGFWQSNGIEHLYGWRRMLRLLGWAILAAVALVAVPILAIAAGLVVFPLDFLAKLVGGSGAAGLVGWYVKFAEAAFAAEALPTWLPRLVVLVLGLAASALMVGAVVSGRRYRRRGAMWWLMIRSPLSTGRAVARCWTEVWSLLRGATAIKTPLPLDLARSYAELLADNLGQPGFRELMIVVHDVDAGRDLVFALLAEARRRNFVRRSATAEAAARRAEFVDLAGAERDHLVDAVSGALAVALVTDPHRMTFAAGSYWRGETHRLCDRPASLWRLIEELEALDVEQIILVSAASDAIGPHELSPARIDGLGRLGEYLQSSEAATIRDAVQARRAGPLRLFTIRPVHNPIGPFEFGGGFDDRSDRREGLGELMGRGYEDAYQQFIEPVVGASGDRVGAAAGWESAGGEPVDPPVPGGDS